LHRRNETYAIFFGYKRLPPRTPGRREWSAPRGRGVPNGTARARIQPVARTRRHSRKAERSAGAESRHRQEGLERRGHVVW